MKIKQILSSLLAATMIFGSVTTNAVTVESDDMPRASGAAVETVQSGDASTVNSGSKALAIKNGVIFHAWSWSFKTITENLDDIAAAGYTAIQTSPPSECYSAYDSNRLMGVTSDGKDGAWWWHYQPTKLAIGNYQLGTRDEYIQMCSAAESRGIKIIADIVANHTTAHYVRDEDGNEITTGQIDVDPEFIEAVGGYDQLYHEHGFDEVKNPTRTKSINYMDGGLPDINTENPRYQAYLIEYMNDLIACGCDGFRFDTAKIIGVDKQDGASYDFWNAVTGQKTITNYRKTSKSEVHKFVTLGDTDYDGTVDVNASDLFYYGEIVNDHSYDSKYRNYIAVTDDTYSYYVREAVRTGSIPTSCTSSNGALNSQSVVWVESHDNYCGDSKYTAKMLTENNIKLNWAIITARNVGTPLFYNRPEGSDALNGNYWGTNTIGNKGNDQFKDPEIVAVNKFRTAMLGTSEYLYNLNSNKIMQIDRYSSSMNTYGSCIVNVGDAYSIQNAPTKLTTGTYIDAVTGNEFTVTSSRLSGSVPASSVTVLYKKDTYNDAIVNAVTSSDTFTDTLTVTPALKNAAVGNYTVSADDRVVENGTFTDATDFIIGGSVSLNGITEKVVSLTLSVTGSNGNTVSRTYKYKKTNSSAYVPDTSSIENKAFVYFFDTMTGNKSTNNFYVTLSGASGSQDGKMEYNDDLHCYLYAYDSSAGYTKILFTDNNKIKTSYLTLHPGKLFALTGYNCGSWIDLNKIKKHTVYFDNFSHLVGTSSETTWDNGTNRKPYAYIWNGNGGELAPWTSSAKGMPMTSIGNVGSYTRVYSLTYYYPEISNTNKNYRNILFNNNGSNQTYDMTLPLNDDEPSIFYTENTGYSKTESKSSGTVYYWEFTRKPITQSDESLVTFEDQDNDLTTYKYVYFFNYENWSEDCIKITLKNSGGSSINGIMKYSDVLHCYYYKYQVSGDYSKVVFSDYINPTKTTSELTLQPGKVYVPNGNSGSWISPSDIEERKVFFKKSSDNANDTHSWANVYAYCCRNAGETIANEEEPGEQTVDIDGTYFSYTYYTPNNMEMYDSISFNAGHPETNKTASLSAPDNSSVIVYTPSDVTSGSATVNDPRIYECTVDNIVNGNVDINIHYYDYKLAQKDNNQIRNEYTYTLQDETVEDGDIRSTVSNAVSRFNMNNQYDEYKFHAAQFDYVKTIASASSSGIVNSSVINPMYYSYQTVNYRGAYSDISDLNTLYSNNNKCKWVTYRNGSGTEISPENVSPNFSNVASIDIYAYSTPKNYVMNFYYPVMEKQNLVQMSNSVLYRATTGSEHSRFASCAYNELISTSNSNINTGMVTPAGFIFDGWYRFSDDGKSYIKVSSDIVYTNRVTSSMDLYAVYRKSNRTVPNAVAIENGVDKFITTDNGNTQINYRFNTIIGINDISEDVEEVGVVYVKLGQAESSKNISAAVTNDFKNSLSSVLSGESSASTVMFGGKSENFICNTYTVGSDVTLTNKNRLQFVLRLKKTTAEGEYANTLAFTAFRTTNGSWVISDNCVYYKNGTPETVYISSK